MAKVKVNRVYNMHCLPRESCARSDETFKNLYSVVLLFCCRDAKL
jgi:hypothetical protein